MSSNGESCVAAAATECDHLDLDSPGLGAFKETLSVSPQHEEFDRIVGELENIVVGDDFAEFQQTFFDEHCQEFDDQEENKLSYMEIFKSYHDRFEAYLEAELRRSIPGFSMERFTKQLESHKNDIDVSILDMLLAMDNFLEFKALMLSHKAAKEGRGGSVQLEISIQNIV